MKTLAQWAARFERLLERLPGPIRRPVEREWQPLKELFILSRPARLLIVGRAAPARCAALFPTPIVHGQESTPWRLLTGNGLLHFHLVVGEDDATQSALTAHPADLILFAPGAETLPADLALLQQLHRFQTARTASAAPIVAIGEDTPALARALHPDTELGPSIAAIHTPDDRSAIHHAVANALPNEARLEFARLTGEKAIQRDIAAKLTRSISAVCAAIGAQPIPLADFPILTSLQLLLVAGIVHVSGRRMNQATARDFLGAMGVNVGLGLAFREIARAGLKLLPGWGNAISGGIAAAGTYAVGRAATAYFIDGLSLKEVRLRFQSDRARRLRR